MVGLFNFFTFFLIGDLYGPAMPSAEVSQAYPYQARYLRDDFFSGGELSNLISQALQTDKIVLENEGLDLIYPTYIQDAILAISKLVFLESPKNVHPIVSEPAKTSLSVAYEIQNAATLILGKELGLFFAGPKSKARPEPEPIIKEHEFESAPKVKLADGLKNTFTYFYQKGAVAEKVSEKTEGFQPPKEVSVPTRHPQTFPSYRQRITSKIPKLTARPKLRATLILFLVILLVFVAKTALDIYLGLANLKAAQSAIKMGDLKQQLKPLQFLPYRFRRCCPIKRPLST